MGIQSVEFQNTLKGLLTIAGSRKQVPMAVEEAPHSVLWDQLGEVPGTPTDREQKTLRLRDYLN